MLENYRFSDVFGGGGGGGGGGLSNEALTEKWLISILGRTGNRFGVEEFVIAYSSINDDQTGGTKPCHW